MELIKELREKFPNLNSCEIINPHDEKDIKQLFPDNKKDEELLPWLSWLLKETRHFNLIRVRLNSGKELVVRRVGTDNFLTIINEKENVPMLMSFIRGIDISLDPPPPPPPPQKKNPKKNSQAIRIGA